MMHTIKIAFVVGVSLLLGGVSTARAGIIEDLGPEMWFDATVASSITANGTNQVTSWADLASGGRVATAGASTNVLLGNNGPYGTPSIDFTAAGTMGFSANQISTGKTVFTLFQSDDTNIAWTNPIGGNLHLTDGDHKGYRAMVRSGGAFYINPQLSHVNEWAIQTMEYDIADRYSLWVDGNLEGTLTNTNSTTDFQGLGHNGFNGSIAQVVVFDGALTDVQRQGVEQQMMLSLASTIHVGGENTIGTDILTGTQDNEVTIQGIDGARVVKITQNLPGKPLMLGEVQAIETGTLTNVALGESASQSTRLDLNNYGPELAIDNNTGNFSHTIDGQGEWWQVELAADADLDKLTIFSRVGCCNQGRTADIQVQVFGDVGLTNMLFDEQVLGIGTSDVRDVPLGTLVSADLVAKLADVNTYVFELDGSDHDQLTVDNPDPSVFTTILDVNNAT
ncbi:MAG: discoidin domain-containing protein, partial [Planctomycetes bacterium]|nr:discoidin domain-containing protein [Planctomycetota bacterium]